MATVLVHELAHAAHMLRLGAHYDEIPVGHNVVAESGFDAETSLWGEIPQDLGDQVTIQDWPNALTRNQYISVRANIAFYGPLPHASNIQWYVSQDWEKQLWMDRFWDDVVAREDPRALHPPKVMGTRITSVHVCACERCKALSSAKPKDLEALRDCQALPREEGCPGSQCKVHSVHRLDREPCEGVPAGYVVRDDGLVLLRELVQQTHAPSCLYGVRRSDRLLAKAEAEFDPPEPHHYISSDATFGQTRRSMRQINQRISTRQASTDDFFIADAGDLRSAR